MPSFVIGVLDSERRVCEKQASRDRDRLRLNSGSVDREELRRENGFFSSLPLQGFRIAAVGGRRVGKLR